MLKNWAMGQSTMNSGFPRKGGLGCIEIGQNIMKIKIIYYEYNEGNR